jgi:hypothetical protein
LRSNPHPIQVNGGSLPAFRLSQAAQNRNQPFAT